MPIAPALRDEMERALAPMRGEWRKTTTPAGRKLAEVIDAELAKIRRK
jgi:hypothetical protein